MIKFVHTFFFELKII